MRDLKCLGCQQTFDDRKLLFDHLQKNASHKRGKKTFQPASSKSQSQPRKSSHAESKNPVLVVSEKASIQACTTSLEQHIGNRLSWLFVSAAQELFLRQMMPVSCHPLETLRSSQYHLENRTRTQLEQIQTCLRCNRKRNNTGSANRVCMFHTDQRKAKGKHKARPRTCCTSDSRGCQTLPEHAYPPVVHDDFVTSPSRSSALHNHPHTSKRFAVVLDCEMVGVKGGSSELAQLCVIDLVTAEVLINSLIQPTKLVVDWRTKYSGIKASDMVIAVRNKQALQGWKAAQMELSKYIDSDTVLIGHALHHDLKALHLIHHRIMDTSIMTRLAVSQECRRNWSLKTLCAELANRDIQNNGARGHNCLEDAFATREVFLRCILDPEGLARWASERLVEEQVKELARRMAKTVRAERANPPTADCDELYDEEDDSYEPEVLRWEDIAEDLGWPHPDTGYDPWSD